MMYKPLSVFTVVVGAFFVLSAGVSPTAANCGPRCGKNEEYSECANANCRPYDCSEVGYPDKKCPVVSSCDCKPGCICQEGFVRKNGTCIPATDCPSCRGDKNAVYGCGGFCNRRCSDLNKPPKACKFICIPNSCDCKDGLYYDDQTGKCVYPKQCTPECKKKNEVPSNCVNAICEPRNCSQVGIGPLPCPDVGPCDCIGGCVCKDDYVYDNKGNCIPRKNCSECGGDPNAVSGCGNCIKRCIDLDSKDPIICTQICYVNRCDCKDDLVLDTSTGKCIHPKDCVTCGGDPNAKPGCDTKCKKVCPGQRTDRCPPNKNCICKDNFYYDFEAGKCVLLKDCTPSKCD